MRFTHISIISISARLSESDFKEFREKGTRAGDEVNAQADNMSIIAGEGGKHLRYASDRLNNYLEPFAVTYPPRNQTCMTALYHFHLVIAFNS